jgi:hypothetical protein
VDGMGVEWQCVVVARCTLYMDVVPLLAVPA